MAQHQCLGAALGGSQALPGGFPVGVQLRQCRFPAMFQAFFIAENAALQLQAVVARGQCVHRPQQGGHVGQQRRLRRVGWQVFADHAAQFGVEITGSGGYARAVSRL